LTINYKSFRIPKEPFTQDTFCLKQLDREHSGMELNAGVLVLQAVA